MIALTQGQLRRRLVARVRAALWSMPWWVILMGLLFHGSGQLLFKGGKLAMGTCADCCAAGGCGACAGVVCANCAAGAAGKTPSTYTVTLAPIDIDGAVCCPTTGAYRITSPSGTFSGTFTLTQLGGFPCEWVYQDASPIRTWDIYTPPTCGSPTLSATAQIVITLTRGTASTFSLSVTWSPSSGASRQIFNATISVTGGADCCSTLSFPTNDYAAFTCSAGPSIIGKNGSAVATVC